MTIGNTKLLNRIKGGGKYVYIYYNNCNTVDITPSYTNNISIKE